MTHEAMTAVERLNHELALIGMEYASRGLERQAATITEAIEALTLARVGAEEMREVLRPFAISPDDEGYDISAIGPEQFNAAYTLLSRLGEKP